MRLAARDFVYLAVILDVFTRCVRGWHLSRSLDRELTLTALRRALTDRVPEIHHSDQGWQYACSDYVNLLTEYGVQISIAAVGKPEENGYAERLMRTIKEEEVDTRTSTTLTAPSGAFWMTCTPASAFTRRWAISRLPNLRKGGWLTSQNWC